MRKDVNKKSNNKSKVVSALAMLLVSAVALSSASYAWFTMSRSVSVEGIQLQATAPDNVLIAANSEEQFKNIASYASSKTLAADSADMYRGGTEINLNSEDLLLPCSSTNGVKLYATQDIQDDGHDKVNDEGKGLNYTEVTVPKADATTNEIYYVDIPLYILTTGSNNVKVAIDTKESTITPGVADTNIYNAVRFAVLDDTKATNIGGTFAADANLFGNPVKSINNDTKNATYATDEENKAIALLGSEGAGTGTVAGTEITLKGTETADDKNVEGKYEYKKVVVRVWIEGQNEACVTANADQTFNVNLVFKAVK